MLRHFGLSLSVLLLIALGCSSGGGPLTPDVASESIPVYRGVDNDWIWGQWMFYVNEDHTSIEVLPLRDASWHINVLKFVENDPCPNCLMIGKPHLQPDGSVNLQVMLSHPFPGKPKYTGFDVRGTVVFPATRYWFGVAALTNGKNWDEPYIENPPLNFSWHGDGGGFLLNADGYSYYFRPGFDLGEGYEQPIFHYQDGKYATDNLPDSTVNPYLTFNDGSPRRMFKTTDMIQRTYNLLLPEGEFSFGYIVEASWVPPDNIPVTDPAQDFPPEANTEDPIILSFEQIAPLDPYDSENNPDETPIFAECHYLLNDFMVYKGSSSIYSPDIFHWLQPPWGFTSVTRGPEHKVVDLGNGEYKSGLFETLGTNPLPEPYIDGTYLALLVVLGVWPWATEPDIRATLLTPVSFLIIEIDLESSGG